MHLQVCTICAKGARAQITAKKLTYFRATGVNVSEIFPKTDKTNVAKNETTALFWHAFGNI